MFEETIGNLRQSLSAFDSKVQDIFGRSIDEKVFEPIDGELGRLESAYTEAELKMREINAIMIELRTIV
jgi:hypothetical protein